SVPATRCLLPMTEVAVRAVPRRRRQPPQHAAGRAAHTMWRRLLAEFTGTALLVSVVVGSGIAAQQLSPTDSGLQLLENSTATVFGLSVLLLIFGTVSGAD